MNTPSSSAAVRRRAFDRSPIVYRRGAIRCVRAAFAFMIALEQVPSSLHAGQEASRDYADTRQRFSLRLPTGWALAPLFGDLYGMSFHRPLGPSPNSGATPTGATRSRALLIVHVDPVPSDSLAAFADALEQELISTTGASRERELIAEVAGQEALVREYHAPAGSGEDEISRIRSYFFEDGGHRYILRLDAPESAFRQIEPDLAQMLKSFRPLAGRAPAQRETPEGSETKVWEGVGRWKNGDGLIFELRKDDSFLLGDVEGHYRVAGHTLTLVLPGKGQEAFEFLLDAPRRSLTLNSSNLGAPMVYRAVGSAHEDRKGDLTRKESLKVEPASPIGRWSTARALGGELVLELESNGKFRLGTLNGIWKTVGHQLVLSGSRGERILYHFSLRRSGLLLSGGDLDAPLEFERRSGS